MDPSYKIATIVVLLWNYVADPRQIRCRFRVVQECSFLGSLSLPISAPLRNKVEA
jgi:hypothetical protein